MAICSQPGCATIVANGGRCEDHGRPKQPSPASRGYGHQWRQVRARFLAENPRCVGVDGSHHPNCNGQATVPDHDPLTRRELLALGVPDPDAFHRLQPRSDPCHKLKTLRYDGAWGNPKRKRI